MASAPLQPSTQASRRKNQARSPVSRAALSYTSPLASANFRGRRRSGGSSGLFRARTKRRQGERPKQVGQADLIVEPARAASGLDVTAALLAFEPALLRAQGRL